MFDKDSIDDFVDEPKKPSTNSLKNDLDVIVGYKPTRKEIALNVAKDVVKDVAKSLSPFCNFGKDIVLYVKDIAFYFSKGAILGIAFPSGAQDRIGNIFYNQMDESLAKHPDCGSMFVGSLLGATAGIISYLAVWLSNPDLIYMSLATNSLYWGYKGYQKLNEKAQEVKQKLIEEHNKKIGLLESSPLSISDGKCPVCGQLCEEIRCAKCNTLYHKDCWDYIGGCSIYGCKNKK